MEIAKLIISILALIISGISIYMSVRISSRLKNQDISNEKRRLFITALWDRLTAVKGLNPGNANKERVFEVLNTLELAALCCDEDIVDKTMVTRAFGSSYSRRVDEIKDIAAGKNYDKVLQDLGMDGPTLLQLYSRIEPVRDEIRREMSKRP
jgi:hypothetical protein